MAEPDTSPETQGQIVLCPVRDEAFRAVEVSKFSETIWLIFCPFCRKFHQYNPVKP